METCEFCKKTWTPQNWMDMGYRCSKCGRTFCNDCAINNVTSIGGVASISKSCPICDRGLEPPKQNNDAGGCYIATAAYGSYSHPTVMVFRQYRDLVLYRHLPGRVFINIYYRTSPFLSKYVKKRMVLQNWSRTILDKIAANISRNLGR